jgi:hypothetical protein
VICPLLKGDPPTVFEVPELHVSGMAGATTVPRGPRRGVSTTTAVAWGGCAVGTSVGSDVSIGTGGGPGGLASGVGVADARVIGRGPPLCPVPGLMPELGGLLSLLDAALVEVAFALPFAANPPVPWATTIAIIVRKTIRAYGRPLGDRVILISMVLYCSSVTLSVPAIYAGGRFSFSRRRAVNGVHYRIGSRLQACTLLRIQYNPRTCPPPPAGAVTFRLLYGIVLFFPRVYAYLYCPTTFTQPVGITGCCNPRWSDTL